MSNWLNKVTIAAPRNSLAEHTVSPSFGTIIDGVLFTPTVGRKLVAIAGGSVTQGSNYSVPTAPPANWTAPTNNQGVNNGGLYLWHRTVTGDVNDTLRILHNGPNYPIVITFMEFPSDATIGPMVSATSVASGAAGPTLSGLSNTQKYVAAVANQSFAGAPGAVGATIWSRGTKIVDTAEPKNVTDGYVFSIAEWNNDVEASRSSSATMPSSSVTTERLVFSVTSASFGVPANVLPNVNAGADFTVDPNKVDTFALTGVASDSDGTIATTTWEDITSGATIINGPGLTRTIAVPRSVLQQTKTYRLTVVDNAGGTSTDTVVVTILPHRKWLKTSTGLTPLRVVPPLAIT